MRICLVSEEYPPETAWGGIGTYTWHLGNIIVKRGHSVYVISTTMGDTGCRRTTHGVLLCRIALPQWPHFSLTEWRGSIVGRTMRSYQVARALSALVNKHGVELVEAPDSRVGEMAEMIQEHSCGYLVAPNRNDRLLQTTVYLLNELQMCRQMGQNAQSRIRQYAPEETIAEQVVRFYQSVIRNKSR